MKPRKILIVDDEEVTLTLLSKILSEHGFEIIEAKTGEDAVKKAQKHNPNLILMDLMLPDFDGADAIKKIHESPSTKDIKVMFLSSIAYQGDSEIEKISKIKVGNNYHDIIAKPINLKELLQGIEKNINET